MSKMPIKFKNFVSQFHLNCPLDLQIEKSQRSKNNLRSKEKAKRAQRNKNNLKSKEKAQMSRYKNKPISKKAQKSKNKNGPKAKKAQRNKQNKKPKMKKTLRSKNNLKSLKNKFKSKYQSKIEFSRIQFNRNK